VEDGLTTSSCLLDSERCPHLSVSERVDERKFVGEVTDTSLREEKELKCVRRFSHFALSSFWQGQYENEAAKMAATCDLREGPLDFDFLITVEIHNS
jgi:hypothetical protein